METYKKKKSVLVLGLGISGRSAVHFLLKKGIKVFGVDSKHEILAKNIDLSQIGASLLLDSYLTDVHFNDVSYVVVSPGVPPSHFLLSKARSLGIPIMGEVELALREVTIPCVGITGTNGKTTVTLLISHILNSSGKSALSLGNIGTPIAEAVDQLPNYQHAVIELSSFQIDTLDLCCLDIGVLLNITPDHLDRYHTMEAYAKSKAKIADLINPEGIFVVFEDCVYEFPHLFQNKNLLLYGYSSQCKVRSNGNYIVLDDQLAFEIPKELQNGKSRSHDIENIMAAFAVCQHYGVSSEEFLLGLSTFQKPHHRIEFVKEIDGITFYDDSKGTNIDAVVRAVDSLPQEIILIAGGVDKGAPYTPWITVFRGKVKAVCAIGQSAGKIQEQLQSEIPVTTHSTLEDAVKYAFSQAQKGNHVLLSPGCSSFDMFKDYVHRGQEFQRIVRELV